MRRSLQFIHFCAAADASFICFVFGTCFLNEQSFVCASFDLCWLLPKVARKNEEKEPGTEHQREKEEKKFPRIYYGRLGYAMRVTDFSYFLPFHFSYNIIQSNERTLVGPNKKKTV